MINNTIKLKAITSVAVLFLSAMLFVNPGYCNTIKKVAVCPLEMNSTQDLSFLQKGLFSMLSSRLADPGKVEILERDVVDQALSRAQSFPATKGALNESKAKVIGSELDVDYVLFGSLTMFGNSVSLDMSMVDIKENKPALTFSRQAKEQGAVITELDQIAAQINYKTFGRHPEELIPTQQYAQRPAPAVQSGGYASPLTNYRHLFAASGEIIGISSGDVDGDKKNEVVIIYDHAIEILKDNFNGKLKSVKKIEGAHYMDIIGVDVADINHNGYAEIFVTRVHSGTGLANSLVLEYDKTAYKQISGSLPWYLRVVKNIQGGDDILYAQKSVKDGPYKGRDVFKVNVQDNSYVPGEKISVPKGFSIMSFTAGDLRGNNSTGMFFTDKFGKLTIFNETGSAEWSGEDGYGGSMLFYSFIKQDKDIQEESSVKGEYFQPRNIVFDIDSDGKNDVLAIRNKDSAGGLFEQLRYFKKSSIEILNWSEMGMASEKAAKHIPGQTTDIAIGDYDNNSKRELIITIIKKRNNFSSKKSKSMIIAYDL